MNAQTQEAWPDDLHAVTPEPVDEGPQPLLREIPRGANYPVEALGPLRQVAEAVHDLTQAPIAIAAQSALSVASLAVQGFADVETLGGYAPASLYCLTVAQSVELKSACDKRLMRGLREHERACTLEHADAHAEWSQAHKLWTAKRDRMVREASGTKKNKVLEAEADLDALEPEPKAPLAPNLTASEPTLEGLAKLYMVGQPSLGLFSDEAGV